MAPAQCIRPKVLAHPWETLMIIPKEYLISYYVLRCADRRRFKHTGKKLLRLVLFPSLDRTT